MITRIFGVALGAGCAAGIALAVLQALITTPLILQAESYEVAGLTAPALHQAAGPQGVGMGGELAPYAGGLTDHGRVWLAHSSSEHDEAAGELGFLDRMIGAWAPEDGLERTFYTSLSSILTGFGFGLMLLAAMLLGARRIDATTGLQWGLGAFAAVALAPALGLPPELPGSAAAELVARQTWWVGTAIATGLGLWLVVARGEVLLKVAGVLVIIAPHLIGAPHPHEYASRVPAELQGHFVAASMVSAAVFWAVLGSALGWFWQRGERA